MTRDQSQLFLPDIFPTKGGIAIHQNGKIITIPDGEVERFVDDLREVRKRQLVADCMRIAEVA